MMNQIKKRISIKTLSAAMAVWLLVQPFSLPWAQAAEDTRDESVFVSEASPALQYDPDERVSIIIELEEVPLLEAYKTNGRSDEEPSDFIASMRAVPQQNRLAAARSALLSELYKSGVDWKLEHQYSAVFNGISVEADAGDLEAIRELDGVKDAFVAQRYELDPNEKIMMTDSVQIIGSDKVNETGYTGKGAVVAILDTGLDETSRKAFFSGAVAMPKYEKDDVARLLQSNRLTVGSLSVDVLYKSEKIPYAYDYAGNDYNVSGGEAHGTHVAGTVGANKGEVIGVAPDAQLMIMKVFADGSGGAYDDNILAALDDSVKLGADVINMSLGTPAGFSEPGSATMKRVYERVSDAGISLMIAAGNSYSAAHNGESGNELMFAANPDNATVSSPSTYEAALSVASANNTLATSPYFAVNGNKIRYDDSADEPGEKALNTLSGTYEYVDCGFGAPEDFSGKELAHKIALIERGGTDESSGSPITFNQKETRAKEAGAIAAVVYDNANGSLVSMATPHAIPCVSISRADGELMRAADEKKLTISADYIDKFADGTSGKMSDFSSWGITPDMKIKPEITAPGGNIYSTVPGGKYASMSGTSMAAPHMAGAAAVMAQYVNSELDGTGLSTDERARLATALMMSTAVPVEDENGLPASPRKQGAGMVRLDRATKTPVYLTGKNGERPAASLGDDEAGSFSFRFEAANLSGDALSFDIEAKVLTETLVTEDGVDYIAEKARVLGSDMVTVAAPASVTVPANGETDCAVDISLTEKGKAELKRLFPNGIFVEGFLYLKPQSGGVELSMPFVGFYGDWGSLPMFDASVYDGAQPANLVKTALYQFDNYSGGGYTLGETQYGKTGVYNKNWIAIKGGDKLKHVTAALGLLRSLDTVRYAVYNESGELVYANSDKRVSKSYYEEQSFHTPMDSKGWTPYDEWNSPLPDGSYTYTVTGTLGGRSESVSFPIVIDSKKPEVVSSSVEGNVWTVKVKDNHYVQAVCATLGSSAITGYINPDQSAAGETVSVSFDLSSPAFTGLKQAKIAVVDYADNQFVSGLYELSGENGVQPASITLDKSQQMMRVGEKTSLSARVLPENAADKTVKWTSSDENVAAVSDGTVTAIGEGTAQITAETVNGLSARCSVNVLPAQNTPTTALVSLSAPSRADAGEDVPFTVQLEQLNKVATVCFTIEKSSELAFKDLVTYNGFTALDGIRWNGDEGILMMSYLAGGAGGSLSTSQLIDAARLIFAADADSESVGLRIKHVSVSGYDAEGNAVWLRSDLKTPSATVKRGGAAADKYDVNGDGVIDQLDITCCQKYYQVQTKDEAWNRAAACDVDGNGKIDLEDMMLILRRYMA